MPEVLVAPHPGSLLTIIIDLQSQEWSALLPENISSFNIEETKRPCSAYKDGIFPGCRPFSEKNQIFLVGKFSNYIEFTKIVSDEVVPISGNYYLTTKFYDRRAEAIVSKDYLKKEGEIMGYCIDGNIYCAEDKSLVYKTIYQCIYKQLIAKEEPFLKLQEHLRSGANLELRGENAEFMESLKEILLEDNTLPSN